jgi:hypothetical protein
MGLGGDTNKLIKSSRRGRLPNYVAIIDATL